MASLFRYLNTVKHLKAKQLYTRLYKYIPRRVKYEYPDYQLTSDICGCTFLNKKNAQTQTQKFTFIGITKTFESEIDWDFLDHGILWSFNLHYFDYINAPGTEAHIANSLIVSWCNHESNKHKVGMHPYPTSLRVVNWIKYDVENSQLNTECRNSLYQQCLFLFNNIEYDVMANHLLANAKALIFAGVYFSSYNSTKWLDRGLTILGDELAEQILIDGAHYERSPMYHSIIIEDFIDILFLLSSARESKSPHLVHNETDRQLIETKLLTATAGMCEWLETVTHPDGELAFFNDCARGIAQPPAVLLEYFQSYQSMANETGRHIDLHNDKLSSENGHSGSVSGIRKNKIGAFTLFTNIAPIEPRYQPSHAHADTLSFELSVGTDRIFVNSGTSTYNNNELRQFQRSTKAHNTVELNNCNSSDVWKSFRVAKKARVVESSSKQNDNLCVISGSHAGYSSFGMGTLHKREWRLTDTTLTITDEFPGTFSAAKLMFYLHPSITYLGHGLIQTASGIKLIWTSSEANVKWRDTYWYPEFGVSIPNTCIEITMTRDKLNKSVHNQLSLEM